MPNRIAVANGADPIQQKAADDANAVQNGVNIVAIVGCFHVNLLALHRRGICGDDLFNHPVALAFLSKLNSLCRMTLSREMAALQAIDLIEQGQRVEYEVRVRLRSRRRLRVQMLVRIMSNGVDERCSGALDTTFDVSVS